MIQRSQILGCAAIVVLVFLAAYLAFQAGYFGIVADERPYLWKSKYVRLVSSWNEMDRQISNLSRMLQNERKEYAALRTENQELAWRVANCSSENDRLTSTVLFLQGRLDEQNKSFEELRRRLLHVGNVLNETEATLARVLQERDMYKALYLNASATSRQLSQNISSLVNTLTQVRQDNLLLSSQIQNLTSQLQCYKDSVSLPGEIYRTFTWYYITQRKLSMGQDGKRGSGFNRTEYMLVATSKHYPDTENEYFTKVVSVDSPDVDNIADLLYSQGRTDLQRVTNILKFVQYLPYIWDDENHSYIRYPLETLVEGGGDCEDTSVLAARLMMDAGDEGYPVALLTVDTDGDGEEDHMMVGVSVDGATGRHVTVDGTDYYICETTSTYYGVGFMPPGYEVVEVIPVG